MRRRESVWWWGLLYRSISARGERERHTPMDLHALISHLNLSRKSGALSRVWCGVCTRVVTPHKPWISEWTHRPFRPNSKPIAQDRPHDGIWKEKTRFCPWNHQDISLSLALQRQHNLDIVLSLVDVASHSALSDEKVTQGKSSLALGHQAMDIVYASMCPVHSKTGWQTGNTNTKWDYKEEVLSLSILSTSASSSSTSSVQLFLSGPREQRASRASYVCDWNIWTRATGRVSPSIARSKPLLKSSPPRVVYVVHATSSCHSQNEKAGCFYGL